MRKKVNEEYKAWKKNPVANKTWTNAKKHFRDALEVAGVTASRYEEDGAWKYVHVLNVNVSDIAKVDNVFQNALKCLVCRVLDSKTLKGEVKAFVERLGEEHEQLHFV